MCKRSLILQLFILLFLSPQADAAERIAEPQIAAWQKWFWLCDENILSLPWLHTSRLLPGWRGVNWNCYTGGSRRHRECDDSGISSAKNNQHKPLSLSPPLLLQHNKWWDNSKQSVPERKWRMIFHLWWSAAALSHSQLHPVARRGNKSDRKHKFKVCHSSVFCPSRPLWSFLLCSAHSQPATLSPIWFNAFSYFDLGNKTKPKSLLSWHQRILAPVCFESDSTRNFISLLSLRKGVDQDKVSRTRTMFPSVLFKMKPKAFITALGMSLCVTLKAHVCLTAQAVQTEMLCDHT